MDLKIKRDFLSDEEHIQLLHWLEKYIFIYETDKYLTFVVAVLTDDFTVSLLPMAELRRLFNLIISQSLIGYNATDLKERYLTPEEKQAEKEAKTAADNERAIKRRLEEEQQVRSKYSEKFDGSFASVTKFIKEYQFDDAKEFLAAKVIHEALPDILQAKNNELDRQDAVQFLFTCSKLVAKRVMTLCEAQNYISTIKEVAANDAENN